MNLQLSNEARIVALAVRTSYFVFHNRMILEPYNYYFVLVFQDNVFILFSIKWI